MKINVYYWNNGVGVVNDSTLIASLFDNITQYDLSKINHYDTADIGIYVQNLDSVTFKYNKKNIFIINEEWITSHELNLLNNFECIIVKSKHAKKLLDTYHKNVINTGFFSLDRYFFPKHTGKILHFKGKSIQKNTELVQKNKEITILNSEIKYLTENQVIENLNNHDIHICCSLYEAWGHYLWEAMSCGKLVICSEIPVFKEYLNPELVKFIPTKEIFSYNVNYNFLNTKEYKLRKGYMVDESKFYDVLNTKNELLEFQKKNKELIREYFLYMNNKNKKNFLKVLDSI
jgi:glycosyltransferase involved in cell wall biosynthesis